MYPPGSIIYFTPFYFKDGGTAPKNKYFIILCKWEKDFIVASLPSSQDHVPSFIQKRHGCLDFPEGNFSCYHFDGGNIVTTNGWAFPRPTYIYANWIDTFRTFIKFLHKKQIQKAIEGN